MADVTVTQFAEVLKVPVDRLLAQLDEAGIKVSGAEATISDEAKMELLTHLRRAHGRDEDGSGSPRKITLKRKSQNEIKVATSQGRARTVNVEVRTKKTYLNRSVLQEQARHQQEEIDRRRHQVDEVREQEELREAESRAAELRAREREREQEAEEARLRAEEEAARIRAEEEARQQALAEAQAQAHAQAESRARQESEAQRQKEKVEPERARGEREREREREL